MNSYDHIAQAPIANYEGVAFLRGLEGVYQSFIVVALVLAAIALFIMLILGGYKYITSGGNPKNIESAKRTLTTAILGMVLVASAYLILRFIGVFTGADIEFFRVYLSE